MIKIEPSALHEIRARISSAPYVDPVAFFGAYFPLGMMGSGELRETRPGDPDSRRYVPAIPESLDVSGMLGPVMDVQICDDDAFALGDVVDLEDLRFQIPVGLRPMLAGARLAFEGERFVLYAPDGRQIRLPGM